MIILYLKRHVHLMTGMPTIQAWLIGKCKWLALSPSLPASLQVALCFAFFAFVVVLWLSGRWLIVDCKSNISTF